MVAQEAFCKFTARFFRKRLETHAMIRETAVERPQTEAELTGNIRHLRHTFAQRLRNDILDLCHQGAFVLQVRKVRVEMRDQVL